MSTLAFKPAERRKAKLRLALTGPSGAGKTYSALLLAKGIGGKVAVIDTEKGSASLYAHLTPFDVLELPAPYTPERFIEAVRAAEGAGYDILILDSITHEWSGVGGCLELVDEIARAKFKGNSWSAWNEVTPRHRDFLDKLIQSPLHIIATMRSKTETVQTEENGRKKVQKLGMKAEQREGSEYEFTTVLDIVHDGHFAIASKDRTGLFADKDPHPITPETGEMLLSWLNSGAVEAPTPPAPPKKAEPPKTKMHEDDPPPAAVDHEKEDAFGEAPPPAADPQGAAERGMEGAAENGKTGASTPPAKGKNYEFLKSMALMKKAVGEANYYRILGANGFEHADQIVERSAQVTVYKAMKKAQQEIAEYDEAGGY